MTSRATSDRPADPRGVLLALGAAALYAVGVLLQKQALRDVDPFTATWLGCLAGAVVSCRPALIRQVGRPRRPPRASSTWDCSRPRSRLLGYALHTLARAG